ncbi:MAG TPA: hypothetical protein VK705_06545 [Ferruginibacter sp.]|nr:hypothetical protein [Ferruginibacter sp.]
MTDDTLNDLKLITSTVAPILTFILALLGAFTEKKEDKEFKNGELTYTKKVLTAYGKIILTLLIFTALLTLSGLWVDELIKEHKDQSQKELDAINSVKRDSILNTAKLTLDTVVTALKTTQKIQATAQEMTTTLTNQTERIKKLSLPLFPMKIVYTYERSDSISTQVGGLSSDEYVKFQDIIDAINADDLPPDDALKVTPYHKTVRYKDNPYTISVKNISYNEAFKEADESSLMKLSYLVYKKFVPYGIKLSFYKPSEQEGKSDDKVLTVFANKKPIVNTDVVFSYTIDVDRPDKMTVNLVIEISNPNDISNIQKAFSWIENNKGTLKIRNYSNGGKINKVSIFSGLQYSYPMIFAINNSDRIDDENSTKKIELQDKSN